MSPGPGGVGVGGSNLARDARSIIAPPTIAVPIASFSFKPMRTPSEILGSVGGFGGGRITAGTLGVGLPICPTRSCSFSSSRFDNFLGGRLGPPPRPPRPPPPPAPPMIVSLTCVGVRPRNSSGVSVPMPVTCATTIGSGILSGTSGSGGTEPRVFMSPSICAMPSPPARRRAISSRRS